MKPYLRSNDYQAITALKAQYFRAVDTKQWEQLRVIFTEDAKFEGFGFGIRQGVGTLVNTLGENLATVFSQHLGATPEIRLVTDQTARGVWSMRDTLTWEADLPALSDPDIPGMRGINGYGFYEDEYTRTPEGWRISFSRLVRTRVEALTSEGTHPFAIRPRPLDPTWLA